MRPVAPALAAASTLVASRSTVRTSQISRRPPPRVSGALQLWARHGRKWRVRLQEHRHNPNAGGKLLQDLQPLAANLGGLGVETGYVGAGPIQALDDA